MCGIVGYNGKDSATGVILDGLMRLEYRGYDSAGIALHDGETLSLVKSAGRIRDLKNKIGPQQPRAQVGIGHTRWATHGRPNDSNAHPHLSCDGKIAIVHNGIIENYLHLREELTAAGHKFSSETDTEVVAHLVEDNYKGNLLEAVQKALKRIEGAYALGVLGLDNPGTIVGARVSCPLVVGIGEGETFLASDVIAILNYTRQVHYLDDGELVVLTANEFEAVGKNGKAIERKIHVIDWNPVAAERGGYSHFMLKEIHEQPEVIRNTIGGRTDEARGEVQLAEFPLNAAEIKDLRRVFLLGCGTASYAGMVGKYLIEALAKIPCEVVLASEFRYADPVLDSKTLAIGVSQSGETADTLAALRRAKEGGARTMGIVNVKGSTLTREVDSTVYIHAGPEMGVASTKVYSAMLAAFHLVALHLAKTLGNLSAKEMRSKIQELKAIPQIIDAFLKVAKPEIQRIAKKYSKAENFLYLGRYVNFPTALEGALKLKEVSYIHAEGYAAGEMKHGPIALVEERVPTLAVATAGRTFEKVLSNIKEVKARDGQVIALISEGDTLTPKIVDEVIPVPAVSELLSPLINVVPLQLLAYYIADLRGCDVDQPRNLAKSVTVE